MTFTQPSNKPLKLTKKEAKELGLNRYRSYITDEEYTYDHKEGDKHYRFIVPEGFKYDGASVPRIYWTIVGFLPDGLGRAAALIHDYIYVYKGKIPKGHLLVKDDSGQWVEYQGEWIRKRADKLFLSLLIKGGVPKIRRNLAYWAVKGFGWYPWMKKSKITY